MKKYRISCSLPGCRRRIFLAGCATSHDTGAYVPVNTTVNDLENRAGLVLMIRASNIR